MTWLAPLYLAGALAVAAPILFHLWRRTPRGKRTFSTLMFLTPSPPRVTSVSKIEHWVLLLLRAAALCLLALAFARPVLRIPATIPVIPDETEYVAILVDTSASLQRRELWPTLVKTVEQRLQKLPASSVVGLFHFDDAWTSDLSFGESQKLQPAAGRALALERLRTLKPGWRGTRMGDGLVRTAQAIQEAQASRTLPCPQQIWLVSDLQSGSDLTALREFDWPDDLPVEWVPIAGKTRENAGLQLVTAATEGADEKLRVRVSNASSSTRQKFHLVWGDAENTPCLEIVVPPGQSRVVALPTPPTIPAGRSVLLQGDEEPFDNRLWLPVRQPRQCTVVYLGSEAPNDAEGLRYYLERALASNPRYDVTVVDGTEPILSAAPPALIVASEATPAAHELLPKLLAAGSDLVLVPKSVAAADELLELCGQKTMSFSEAQGEDYALWSEIDFEAPWFAPFAEAQFADFSGIHFWKHRRVAGELPPGSEVLVRFDDRDPAVIQWPGAQPTAQVWFFASGWQPRDSQLSRSSKFVPLMWRVLENALGDGPTSSAQAVGQPLRRPSEIAAALTVVTPSGAEANWPAEQTTYAATDSPGRYEVVLPQSREVVAVNLAAEESRTDPLPPEQLEALGVKLSTEALRPTLPPSVDQLRQQQIQELEERQRLWKWILLAVGGVLVLETLLAARLQAAGVRDQVSEIRTT